MEITELTENCRIIQDLLPLSMDGTLSEDSQAAVRIHLQDCLICRREYERMHRDMPLNPIEESPADTTVTPTSSTIKGKQSRVVLRTVLTILAAVCLLLSGICGMGIWYAWPSWHI